MEPKTDRRAFLKALGLGAASLAACERLPVRHAIPYLVPPEEMTPGIPALYASTCTACPAGCGLVVKVLDGRPVKLEGNEDHPLSRGGLCASGQAWLRSLYDPSRLNGPTVDGEPVTWEALDADVIEGLGRAAAEGRALRVLSRTLGSPVARAAIQAFIAPFGGRLVEHDLDGRAPSSLLEAYELLSGEPLRPALHLDRADRLVSLGSDFLGTGADPVVHTAAWTARRRRGPARLVTLEGGLTLTGAASDERILATASERRAMAFALLDRVASDASHPDAPRVRDALSRRPSSLSEGQAARIAALGAELLAFAGRSLVVSGTNDLGEQLAVALVNRLLHNEGRTVDLDAPVVRGPVGLDRELEALCQELVEDRVGALIVLDVDFLSLVPGGEELANAVGRLPLSVAVTERQTATSAACRAVAAAHHGLERWAEVEPRAGFTTLAQPAVRPLFATRHPIENFLHWSGAEETDYRRHLQAAFRDRGDWESLVRTAGLSLAGSSMAPSAEAPANGDRVSGTAFASLSQLAQALPETPELEVELRSAHALRDPKDAHNPWLRELPDPLTRSSWRPVVIIAPELARVRGIRDGDILELDTGGAGSVSLPASVLPGQHPRVIGVPTGYVDEPAENGFRLAHRDGGRLRFTGLEARLRPTGERDELALVQIEGSTENRPLVHQLEGEDRSVHAPHHPEASLWPEHREPSPHWEMVIDLDTCTGCSACVVACQAENNIPIVGEEEVRRHREMHWLRIDRYFLGDGDAPDVLFEPMLCAQCDNAPCETVCPVAATVHSEDGLNQQIYNRCVGTRYCANNCPYKVRRFNWFDNEPVDPIERLVLNPDVVVRARGVMEKCTFCVQRIQSARIGARRDGTDPLDVVTACQQSCPAQAITFGDGADPESPVARLKQDPRAFSVLAELGVRPSVSYLARVRHRESDGDGSGGDDHGD